MCPNHLPSYYAQVLLQRLCMLCCSAHVFCLSARTFGNTYGFCIQALSLLQMHPWMQKKHAKSADWRSKSQRRRGPISRAQTQEVHHETQKLVAFFGLAFALATCWGAGQIEEKSHSDLHSSPTSPSTSISMGVRMAHYPHSPQGSHQGLVGLPVWPCLWPWPWACSWGQAPQESAFLFQLMFKMRSMKQINGEGIGCNEVNQCMHDVH